MKIKIREFIISDYHEIIKLWKEARLPFKPNGRDSKESIEKELQKGCCIFLVAVDENKIIGSVLGTNDGRKGWINRLAVKTEYRKKGLANQLLEDLEKRFYDLGIGIIACLIEDDNQDSLKVFSKFGYSEFEGMHYLTKRKHSKI
ncbi:MAG: GNAT family N-acetyltransferase [Bacteroidales bacterium]|nr:GNAT family N-acetyltransferase [Bacteroidales bacterium]